MLRDLLPKHRKTPLQLEQELLQAQLEEARAAMEAAYSSFENVLDPDLIDCSIYELNAIQKRYKFLLRQAKQLEQSFSAKLS